MKEDAEIHIALAADSNYIVPITVVLQSIFDHHADTEVHIYLLFIERRCKRKTSASLPTIPKSTGSISFLWK